MIQITKSILAKIGENSHIKLSFCQFSTTSISRGIKRKRELDEILEVEQPLNKRIKLDKEDKDIKNGGKEVVNSLNDKADEPSSNLSDP